MYGQLAISEQTFSLDASKNDTSVVLDLLRASAAQMVCVGHAISFFISQWKPTEFPLMQNVGVLLFFVLSGFLITYTLLERSKNPAYSFINFVVDRFARIYSALLPGPDFRCDRGLVSFCIRCQTRAWRHITMQEPLS